MKDPPPAPEESDDPHAVHEMRTAFSGTVLDTREHAMAGFMEQRAHQEDAGQSTMTRAGSVPGLVRPDADEIPKIKVGVCAMDKKARSKQMRAIIERLLRYGEFEVLIFGDENILHKPVEEWPVVACLLSWHSEGFPLKKAQAYVALRKPYLINDVFAQDVLLDRRQVYRKLTESGIPVPFHIIVDRDDLPAGSLDPPGFIEEEDFVELDGVRINKPFVEKPASGEDHNIHIYYPHSMGGGVKRLFRKVDNRSADYDPSHPGTVRREGSYIYEEFLTTGGTDVKVYTVGPRYAHAEARKSPVVDGKVQRSADGKEVRFPVLLSPQEKEIARMVCLAFGQRVCGFDLLRSERGRSYVCDVNGWSFVKNSQKYYDDAAGILRMVILSAVAPHRLLSVPPAPVSVSDTSKNGGDGTGAAMSVTPSFDDMRTSTAGGGEVVDDGRHAGEELRCVLAVIRHGDRTPKQKMKMVVTQPPLLALLQKYLDSKGKQAKLKSPNELQELLDVTRQLLEELEGRHKGGSGGGSDAAAAVSSPKAAATALPTTPSAARKEADHEADELREKFRIIKTVLEQGGQFAGINRKVQLKPLRWSVPEEGSSDPPRCEEALLILKHGGVLTHAGRRQAEALGSLFRNIMYPQHGPAGGGLLRLHSTYRHDLKIYSSDEGRVQSSAAAFTKGLLDLEGAALTPILVSLVKKDAGMLDAFGKGASMDINVAKQELYAQMTFDSETNTSQFAPPAYSSAHILSPPMSPEPTHNNSLNGSLSDVAANAAAAVAAAATVAATALANNGQSVSRAPSVSSTGSFSSALAPTLGAPGSFMPETSDPGPNTSNCPGRPHIYPMPRDPLSLLRRLDELIRLLVDQLRQKCLDETRSDDRPKSYSALTQDPAEWFLEDSKPCSGEKLLLMFDRWRKLAKAFYSEKKAQFDISKVPDIYDAAKYDSIHNTHIGLSHLHQVYEVAKVLAAAVIPNEYGIQPIGKLRIGSTICAQLLGKLLADLASMREESMATAGVLPVDDMTEVAVAGSIHPRAHQSVQNRGLGVGGVGGAALGYVGEAEGEERKEGVTMGHIIKTHGNGGINGEDDGNDAATTTTTINGGEEPGGDVPVGAEDDDGDDAVLHRLCPTYAQDVNSPLRHVRTRIYFTSESHCHSLINVLRYCHLGLGAGAAGLLSEEGQDIVRQVRELDYMTHVVFRMFENKTLPLDDPRRFRVEILFSPGACHDPYEVVPLRKDHVIPIVPRIPIHDGDESGVPLQRLEASAKPYAKPFKRATEPYALRGVNVNSQASELDYWM